MAKYYFRFGNLDFFIILFQYTTVLTPEKQPPNTPIRCRKIRQKI